MKEATEKSDPEASSDDVASRRERGRVYVWTDGWDMDVKDVFHFRDAIREVGVGDECRGREQG